MSSGEENGSDSRQSSKPKKRIRRLQRACDTCKRKKIRCSEFRDWAASRGNKCTYCRTHQLDCSYTHGDREEKHGTPEEYVESLERSVKLMSAWLYRHHPDLDLTLEFGIPSDIDKWMETQRSSTNLLRPSGGDVSEINLSIVKDEPDSSDDEFFKLADLQNRMENVHIVDRFLGRGSVLGKSSGVALIKSALEMKDEGSLRTRLDPRNMRAKRDPFWDSHACQWEASTFDARLFDFPPTDLMYSLFDIWFNTRSHTLPLLHKPTFMKDLSNGLHYRDGAFAAMVLVVCAIASRFCNDNRVLYTDSWFSAGWKYYHQARMYYKPAMSSPSLHDIQLQVLFCLYLEGSSMPQTCWTTCGMALRLAMDVGAHKKKAYHNDVPNADEEQWKRAFWILVIMDRWLSAQLGRSCSIHEEDFDLDLPIDVDDEYWEASDPSQAFKQPAGRPSKLAFFIALIKLSRVLGVALRSIFSMDARSNILLELIGKGWEQRIITALDSALNEWVDNIPEHLKWDPSRTDPVFVLQSGCMYAQYYELQIMIHRCFIPTPQKPAQTTFPSLAICTNAARSCCQIISSCRQRLPQWRGFIFQNYEMAAFTSSLVLIFSIWGARRNGMAIDTTKDMERICQCMEILKDAEPRWAIAGRLWDILYELVFMGDLPLPSLPPSNEASPEALYTADPPTSASGSSTMPSPPASSSSTSMSSGFSRAPAFIPAHTSDLGRLPLHIPLASMTDPATYGSTASAADPFGATTGAGANAEFDDVLAAFGFGPVSFETPALSTVTGPAATPAPDTSNWPDFSLNVDSSNWNGFFSSLSSAPGQNGQGTQAELDAFWAPQQAPTGLTQPVGQHQGPGNTGEIDPLLGFL